ncbi:MAG: DNA repair protein RecO [Deltaproteobacteria bacterium]|nr:MAG: DNA repair protein RecO [Deltaproteobacteria bacterium]
MADATDALLLRAVPYRDADLIVTLLSRDLGKLSALARGARRSSRRFGARLALFTVGRAELRARRGELWTLASYDVVRDFTGLGGDVAAVAHGSYGLELVRELTAFEQAEPAIFDLVVELFEALAARGASPSVLRAFELRLLELVGLAPELDACIACGDAAALAAAGTVLDGLRGGAVCAACHAGASAKPLPPDALAALRAARATTRLVDAPADGGAGAAAARDALVAMVLAHVGKPLRSLEFIAKMSAPVVPSRHGDG